MKIISTNDVQEWYHQAGDLAEFTHTLGTRDHDELRVVDIPLHLQFAIEKKSRENPDRVVPSNAFDSIPFYSLCRGLFLPLSNLQPERIGQLFGIAIKP